jgi:hypothetical protein
VSSTGAKNLLQGGDNGHDVGHHGTGWAYGWKGSPDNIRAFELNDRASMSHAEGTYKTKNSRKPARLTIL